MKVIITADTYLKSMPAQSDAMRAANIPDGLVSVKAGNEFEIEEFSLHEGAPGAADDHLCVRLVEAPQDTDERNWFIYALHAKTEGTDPDNNPQDSAAAPSRDYGEQFEIPGISRLVGIYEPVYFEPKSSNFTWAEFTKGGRRIPVDAGVTSRIVKLAKYMDEIRAFLGDRPIHITSGYRDPVSNRYVGGARDSRHMYGDAVDFWVEGMDVVTVFYKLKDRHRTGGLAVGSGFVHLDLRPGGPARWTYPGGPRVSLW